MHTLNLSYAARFLLLSVLEQPGETNPRYLVAGCNLAESLALEYPGEIRNALASCRTQKEADGFKAPPEVKAVLTALSETEREACKSAVSRAVSRGALPPGPLTLALLVTFGLGE